MWLHQILRLKVPISYPPALDTPLLGREVLAARFVTTPEGLTLLALSSEDGALHIAQVTQSGSLIAAYTDRSLKTSIKTVHWLRETDRLLLVCTGSRFSRLIYQVSIYQIDASSSFRVGACLVSAATSQEGEDDDLRIMDGILESHTANGFHMLAGCSNGALWVGVSLLIHIFSECIPLTVLFLQDLEHAADSTLSLASTSLSKATMMCTLSLASMEHSDDTRIVFQGSTDGRSVLRISCSSGSLSSLELQYHMLEPGEEWWSSIASILGVQQNSPVWCELHCSFIRSAYHVADLWRR